MLVMKEECLERDLHNDFADLASTEECHAVSQCRTSGDDSCNIVSISTCAVTSDGSNNVGEQIDYQPECLAPAQEYESHKPTELRSTGEESYNPISNSLSEVTSGENINELEQIDYQAECPSALNDIHYSFDRFIIIASYFHPLEKYFIGCKWSPDGTCLLSNCADYSLRLLDLPIEFHSLKELDEKTSSERKLYPSLEMKEGGLIYDYDWYPYMSSWNPQTCCFVASSSGSPVHLWDAYTGKIRASYRAYDYADEVHSAISVAFSTSGGNIYCGFRNFVKLFDVSKPGRECEIFNLKEIGGQKGIVSCISENPAVPELFAVGTFSKTIGLYTKSHDFVFLLNGQKSGLTQIKFSSDGSKLFSGARMDNEIICWDIRNLGKVLFSMERVVSTNQRIYFDVSRDEQYFISGGTDGKLRLWDIHKESYSHYEPKNLIDVSSDCVNGVSFHPSYPIVATAAGQLRRLEIVDDEDEETVFCNSKNNIENSVKLWWVGPTSHKSDSCEDMHTDLAT